MQEPAEPRMQLTGKNSETKEDQHASFYQQATTYELQPKVWNLKLEEIN